MWGELLYVGVAKDTAERFAHHLRFTYWWPDIVQKQIDQYPSKSAVFEAEKQVIQAERPIWNIAHSLEKWSTKPTLDDPWFCRARRRKDIRRSVYWEELGLSLRAFKDGWGAYLSTVGIVFCSYDKELVQGWIQEEQRVANVLRYARYNMKCYPR